MLPETHIENEVTDHEKDFSVLCGRYVYQYGR